ncbi:MAG: DUF4013 domain-containing protein [Eggerthellaceae bacterium]|nr:DUF4013 domain-containing protein [Eggerthellaceae bacterium]
MEKGYFSAAWGDITKSPGWFSKMLRMGLLCFIPIFGVLVVYGYLYGWARDIAWNVHRPMPEKIFGNEDGNLYKRGFFILVIGFVFSLIPGAFSFLTSMVTGVSFLGAATASSAPLGVGSLLMALVFSLAGLVLTFAVVFFYWVGAMRCALYGTLSSGFQFGKIWAMLRYDFTGLLRIFGMSLICGAVVGIAAFIIVGLSVTLSVIFGVAFIQNETQAVIFAVIILLLILILCVVSSFISVLITALISRALGYWTRQFQVNLWGGQEDPMPFELEQARQSQQRYDAYAAQQTYQAQNPYQAGQPYQANQQYQAGQTGQPYQADQQQSAQPYQAGQAAQMGQSYQADQPVQPEQSYQASQIQPEQPSSAPSGEPPIIEVEPIDIPKTPVSDTSVAGISTSDASASNTATADTPVSETSSPADTSETSVSETPVTDASDPEVATPEASSSDETSNESEKNKRNSQ